MTTRDVLGTFYSVSDAFGTETIKPSLPSIPFSLYFHLLAAFHAFLLYATLPLSGFIVLIHQVNSLMLAVK